MSEEKVACRPDLRARAVALDQPGDDGGRGRSASSPRSRRARSRARRAGARAVEERRGIGHRVSPQISARSRWRRSRAARGPSPPAAWSAAGPASAARCGRRSRRRRDGAARHGESSRPAAGRSRAARDARCSAATRRCGRAGRASPGRNSARMRCVSSVEVANFVPMKTAIFGSRPGCASPRPPSRAAPRSAPSRRRSGRCRRG
jgi:hypothetical protein